MRRLALLCILWAPAAFATDILFVGNSFTYGAGAQIAQFRAQTVTDLNGSGVGGVPALFKAFTEQAGLDYSVAVETQAGADLDWHLDHALNKILQRPYDIVVLQSHSLLDGRRPGDPYTLVRSVKQLAFFLERKNAATDVRLVATWSRADQVYEPQGRWYGRPVESMANDIRAGYDKAAAATPLVKGVIPVGEAWNRAIRDGIADANPYDGIEQGKVNLWHGDNLHASLYGHYLQALTIFGSITGRDPRSLGAAECAAAELRITPSQAAALQQVAYDELKAAGLALSRPAAPQGAPNKKPAAAGFPCNG